MINREGLPTNWLQPRTSDLPEDMAYAVRADILNRNFRDLAESIGCPLVTGDQDFCVEGSAQYGASTTTYCRLTLPPDRFEIGDLLKITDGTRVWEFVVAYEDQIEITDTELIEGTAGTANYNAIQSSLIIIGFGKAGLLKFVSATNIALGANANALHGDDIRVSDTDATTLEEVSDDVYTEHEADGTHSVDIIDNDNMKTDTVLATLGCDNLIKNGNFEINDAADSSYWDAVGTGVLTPEELHVCGEFPDRDLKIVVTDNNSGAEQSIARCEKDIPLTMMCWVKGTADKEIKLILKTDTASAEKAITCAGTWEEAFVKFTPDDQCTVKAQILSNETGAQTFYVALVTVKFGNYVQKPERAAADVLYDAVHTAVFYIPTLCSAGADSIYAVWTPQRDIKLIRIDAYVHLDPATDDATIRLTDGSSDVDTDILIGNNSGANASTVQEYAAGAPLTLKVLQNTTTDGTECIIVIQYRMC